MVPKPDNTLRPIIDPTRAGLNETLAPWGMALPTARELLQHITPKVYIAKRDWKHGFHQMTLAPQSRGYLGFRHPASGRIGRFVALPFGAAQSPGRFTEVAVAFTELLSREVDTRSFRKWGLAQYIDDLLFWAETPEQL